MSSSSSLRNMVVIIIVLYLITIGTLHFWGTDNNGLHISGQPPINNGNLPINSVTSIGQQDLLRIESEIETSPLKLKPSLATSEIYIPHIPHHPLPAHVNHPIVENKDQVVDNIIHTIPSSLQKDVEHQPIPVSATNINKKRGTVAYAVTITRDGPYIDGAAVLGQGVKSAHLGINGHEGASDWDYALVAIVHPSVVKARPPLKALGWKIVERDLPFELSEIENQVYANAVKTNGCCGHLELLKLHAWSLLEYDWVVHLDMDSFVLKPMDALFNTDTSHPKSNITLFYTRDYNMSPGKPIDKAPVQGGFFCLKPNMQVYHTLWNIVKKGDFGKGTGWGGSGIGNFWGGMTIQGLLPYYVVKIAPPSNSQEVDRCLYNQMVDAAGDPTSKSKPLATMKVANCRHTPYEQTLNVHFTLCQKPWSCQRGHRQALCMDFHRAWMRTRSDLEKDIGIQPSQACAKGRSGEAAYIPLKLQV